MALMRKILTEDGYAFYKAWRSPGGSLAKASAFYRQLKTLKAMAPPDQNNFPFAKPYPLLNDAGDNAGGCHQHYTQQDLHVAQRIFANAPEKHVDVGSAINGLVTHVASFRPIEIIDIRPFPQQLKNVHFRQANLMDTESVAALAGCTDSLSCLHTIEHFGLGRYGDPIDWDGHLKGLANLTTLLRPGGKFYFSTPIGPGRIEFNAHRVFNLRHLLEILTRDYVVDHFSYEDDHLNFREHVEISDTDAQENFGCRFGCGIFELTKKAVADGAAS